MTGNEFSQIIKAKLNRIDTSSYEEVRKEEIFLFAGEAHKSLILDFDAGVFPPRVDQVLALRYLANETQQTELDLVGGSSVIPTTQLKIKSAKFYITAGDKSKWIPGHLMDNTKKDFKEFKSFTASTAARPHYRLTGNSISVEENNFTASQAVLTSLMMPPAVTSSSVLEIPFMSELQNKTVSLILENLESPRIQTQPVITQ